MSAAVVVTGGDDSKVKIWSRSDGDLLLELDHHKFIVWHVELRPGQLVRAHYKYKQCTYIRFAASIY
jgi:WD40 repeat protein